jgi:hypothetical protein
VSPVEEGLAMFSCATCALAVILVASTAAGSEPTASVRSVDVRLGGPFRLVVASAADRLFSPACAAVLDEFTSAATGRTLGAALAETGLSAPEFVLGLTYFSASSLPPCRNQRVLAYTTPGSRVVFVCPAAFARASRDEPGFAANILIHEALHSLGLADDLPSSLEITRAVERSCGR